MPEVKFINPQGVEETRNIQSAEQISGFEKSGFKTVDNPFTKPSSEVSSISTKDAIGQINSQKGYMDATYPTTPLPTQTTQTKDSTATPTDTGKAYFTNQAGQEAEYTQDQLNDPATQQYLKDNGYVMVKSEGVNVGSDFSVGKTQSGLNDANAQIENLSKDFLNYNVDEDPDYKAQATSIKANFDKLQRQMEKTNYQRAQGLQTLGLRTGTTQYAGAIQSGIEGEELNQANQRIADIVAEEAATISAARSAFKNNKFSEFNNKVNALKDIRDQKQKELENYNTAIANYTKKLQDEETARLQAEKDRVENQAKTISGISTLVFRSLTGDAVTDAKTIADYSKMYDIDPGMLLSAVYDKENEQATAALESKYKKSQLDKNLYDLAHPDVKTQITDVNGQKVLVNAETGEQIKVLGRSDADTVTRADAIKYQGDLRKEFNALDTTKQFNTVKQSYNTVKSAYAEAAAAGKDGTTKSAADQVLIVAFNKMIDPNSVVREGEFARTTQGQSILNRLKGAVDRALEGGTGLSDNDRDAIKSATETLYKDYLKIQGEKIGEYRRIALDAGIDPNKVVKPQSLDDYTLLNPDKIQEIDDAHKLLLETFGEEPTDENIMEYLTGEYENSLESGGNPQVTEKILSSFDVGEHGGQCGEFTHQVADFPPMGNYYTEKQASVDKYGFRKEEWTPQVGDVVISDASDVSRTGKPLKYGHAAVVVDIKPNGDLVLLESNRRGDEKVTKGRTISKDDPAIYGALRGKLKQKFLV